MTGISIAIDGPAGTGKSTVSKEVARRLKLAYFDTGATYRVATLWCMREGVDLAQESDVAALVETMNVSLVLDPRNPRVLLEDEDVSSLIRSDSVALTVSKVATNLEARAALGQWQRDVIAAELEGGYSDGRGVVSEGRDITTVIAPDADVRILMTADEEIRVARRAGEGADLATVREAVLGRDKKDSTVVQFHTAADGVHTLDTSELTIEEAVQAVLDLVAEVRGEGAQDGEAEEAGAEAGE
ncbi:(d)CMP kinase [Demequina mangrovi]|uniref:Cytidylate kinase n=1 Tax=Demequina mangrovi TaxID=1043493 RepID=A0A1H6TMJ3_9MICO|nr:(d)CMP kinase [Demequina mangrovi]SEI81268.1 cytidylate kinase [Demequina mangrovi]